MDSGSWAILNSIETAIKKKIETIGVPLKDWDINIYRGILTGYNDAFIIDEKTKNEIISKSKSTDLSEIIRPILRGRDVQKYRAEWANLYLIALHNGYTNSEGKIVPPIYIDDYPSIKEHLDKFLPQLKIRTDKGFTPYNLRSCIYMDVSLWIFALSALIALLITLVTISFQTLKAAMSNPIKSLRSE